MTRIRRRRWITANIEQLDCAGCLCTIYQGSSILADPERGYLCASCGCDLEIQGLVSDPGPNGAAVECSTERLRAPDRQPVAPVEGRAWETPATRTV